MTVSVIIPAWNEAESIASVLAEIPSEFVNEVLVIDGGSTDGTPEIAAACGARVLIEARRGYGQACATGASAAHGEFLVFMDADGADDPSRLPDFLALLNADAADLVLGSRLAGHMQAGAMPWHQRSGNWFCGWSDRRLYGADI
jgi:glycosyltransferase involved in cell wall biosynthesis